MGTLLFLGNLIFVGLVLLTGLLYPSIKNWSHLAVCFIGIYFVLEMSVARMRLPDAAKISAWAVFGLGNLITITILIPYKLGLGDWWMLLAAGITGAALLIFLAIVLLFRIKRLSD